MDGSTPARTQHQDASIGRPNPGAQFSAGIGEAARKRDGSREISLLRHLLPYLKRRKVELGFALFFLLLAAGATLALPAAARVLVDGGFSASDREATNRGFMLLIGVAIAMAVFSASRFYFVTRFGERVVADLRGDVYTRLISLSQSFFARIRTGEALSRLTVDAALIETLVTSSGSMALRNSVTITGGLAMMLATSPKLTGLVILIIPAVLVPILTVGRRVRRLSATTQDRLADAAAEASETLDAIETVQAFGREDKAAGHFKDALEASFAAALKRTETRAILTALAITIVFGGIALVLWEGARMVMSGDMTAGALTQFVILAMVIGGGAGSLAEVWGDVQKAAGATGRMMAILDEVPDIGSPAAPVSAPSSAIRGRLEFDAVGFRYPATARQDEDGSQQPIAVEDIRLVIEPGQTVAVVGPSGAGKSTLFRLALRLFDPAIGAVRLDGIDARAMDPRDWRAQFAYVSQNPALFSGTASDNIRYGAPDATEADIILAATQAEADSFIRTRLGGYDREIGDRGKALSGGERQRLAIARALVRKSPVLLLDEATSALDAENEQLVQKAFETAMSGRTTLVIAHRLATVRRADRIIVMEQGRIVETGTHDSLVAAGGLYARLADLQFTAG
jgi:ATP-binding cassette, subfamily B, bacterial